MKPSFRQNLCVIAIGTGAGLLNGLLGAGGGILIVAGLRRLFRGRNIDPRSVFASAIAVMLPLSALSAIQYFMHGRLPEADVGLLILPAIAGGAAGALLLRKLTPGALSRIFAGVVLLSGMLLVIR